MRTASKLGIGAASMGALVCLRQWSRRWGATCAEVGAALPGDEIVERPRITSTRAIDIEADPEDVWPWLAQFGQGRGGLYSYQRIENLLGCRIENADRVIPEMQDVRAGDEVRLVPPDYRTDLSFEVAVAEPNRALVLRGKGTREEAFAQGMAFPSWAFVIEPVAAGHVRLLARWRSDYEPKPGPFLTWRSVEPVHFVMERRMLKGIKRRAERLARERADQCAATASATASATMAASSPTP
ncbi:MAG: hypothetical protein ACXVQ0_06370 [Actinomycetota bacterium]